MDPTGSVLIPIIVRHPMTYVDNVTKGALAIAVVAAIIAAAAMIVVFTQDDGDDRRVIYVGMESDATPEQKEAVESFMKEVITETYRSGYTMYWAQGAYSSGSSVVENDTLVIILLSLGDGEVDRIVDAALDQDGVDSVAKETYRSDFILR